MVSQAVVSRIGRFEVWVAGRPAPQGSKSYKGNQRFVEASKYLPAWRKAIKDAVVAARGDDALFTTPVRVKITFLIERPKNPKFDRPGTPPDLDKLCRGVFDALTGTILLDDALVVELEASAHYTSLESGAEITVCNI